MRTIKQNSPQAGEATGGNTEVPVAKTKSTKTVPNKDDDFGKLCKFVNEKWKQNPFFVLLYITQPEFDTMVSQYNTTLSSKKTTAGKRPTITGDLNAADKRINKGISQVKLYLQEKYEEQATQHYASFGIVHKGRNYKFPNDREGRLAGLKLIVENIESEGFADKKYGREFWNELNNNYETMLDQSVKTVGAVSNKVSSKNLLKEQLTEVLNSLIDLLRGNYRKQFKAMLREWGFQKERY
jgi:hypothetical protein